jgi:UV radiation resistance-associated gene protein
MDVASLRARLAILRNELLTTLTFIFPIELLSPPDLLFTILDVPLPIPIGPTDPAPPLSLSSRKDVTEDTVATALGYAAQLVQLLAAYLGQRLVYPITCVGSRSVIKDGISAMVGPRM